MAETKTPILETKKLGITFGGLKAVQDFNIQICQGELVGLIGPNGAGKTTAFNMISGAYKPSEGTVTFLGEDITRLPAPEVCKRGIGRTFQVVRPFGDLSVLENVMVGGFVHTNKAAESRKIAEDVCA